MSPVVKGYAKAFFGNILGFYMGCRRMYWGGGEYLLRRSPAYVVCASDIHEISGWPLPTPRELSVKESRGSLINLFLSIEAFMTGAMDW